MNTRLHLTLPLILAFAVGLSACAGDGTGVDQEIALAEGVAHIAHEETDHAGLAYHHWLGRVVAAVLASGNEEARLLLEEARELRQQARAAREAGDLEEAFRLHQLALRTVLEAVIVVFPDAPEATGAALDRTLERIERFLGDREAPRIRAVVARVHELRDEADAVLESDPVAALALNLRGFHILHRLAHHIRHRVHDHDREAQQDLHAIGY